MFLLSLLQNHSGNKFILNYEELCVGDTNGMKVVRWGALRKSIESVACKMGHKKASFSLINICPPVNPFIFIHLSLIKNFYSVAPRIKCVIPLGYLECFIPQII